MLVHTQNFYMPHLLEIQQNISAIGIPDEVLLYNIVNASGIGMPPTTHALSTAPYRPLHGVHLSLSRGPGKPLCHDDFRQTELWCPLLSTRHLQEYV